MALRITSWNLQGREGLDVDRVASVLVGLGSDVVALQEVQKAQAEALAARLGWVCRWWFKHWSVVHPAEGLAILSPRPLAEARCVHLAHRWRIWSWRRRVAVLGRLGDTLIVDVHLGSGVGDPERARQANLVVEAVGSAASAVVVGDLNTAPESEVMAVFGAAGFRDAQTALHPGRNDATNWRRGIRTGPPTQRLDYVLFRGDVAVADVVVGDSPDPDWARLAALSDHAPVTATLTPGNDPGESRVKSGAGV